MVIDLCRYNSIGVYILIIELLFCTRALTAASITPLGFLVHFVHQIHQTADVAYNNTKTYPRPLTSLKDVSLTIYFFLIMIIISFTKLHSVSYCDHFYEKIKNVVSDMILYNGIRRRSDSDDSEISDKKVDWTKMWPATKHNGPKEKCGHQRLFAIRLLHRQLLLRQLHEGQSLQVTKVSSNASLYRILYAGRHLVKTLVQHTWKVSWDGLSQWIDTFFSA